MKILISAAETSSDAHGAELLRALQAEFVDRGLGDPAGLSAFGIGGPKLKAAGLREVVDARELLSMGFFEVVVRLPRILRALRQVVEAASVERPDVAVVIDYPDFHFKLARRLKRMGVPVVYYIPPKIWVWRRGRLRALRELFARVLCILPFEEPIYRRARIPVKYVGNPLVDELPLSLTRAKARADLGIGEQDRVLTLMPGSRPAEIDRHVGLMLEAALITARKLFAGGRLTVLIPFPDTVDLEFARARVDSWLASVPGAREAMDPRVFVGNAHECLVAADAGLIKSGTSTLEAGILGCPHAVIYKPSALTACIFRNIVRYRGPVGLVNLVAGWREGESLLAREILMERATPDALAEEAISLLTDKERVTRLREKLEKLKRDVAHGSSPSRIAAREVLGVLAEGIKR